METGSVDADRHETYRALMAIEPPWERSAAEVIKHVGRLIDACADAGETAGAQRALQQCERLRKDGSLADGQSALLYYFEANAWSLLRLPEVGNRDAAWTWQDQAFRNEIRCLRMTLRSPGFIVLSPQRRSQIYTNLANALDTFGRSVEAIELYERAVDVWPDHGMAR